MKPIHLIGIIVVIGIIIAGVGISLAPSEDKTPNHNSEPSNSDIANAAAYYAEEVVKDLYPQYSNTIAAFTWNASVTEYDTTWDCGSDHYWVVIASMSINKFESHYYHVTLGFVDEKYTLGKMSISPTGLGYYNWTQIYRSEASLIKIGVIWPDDTPSVPDSGTDPEKPEEKPGEPDKEPEIPETITYEPPTDKALFDEIWDVYYSDYYDKPSSSDTKITSWNKDTGEGTASVKVVCEEYDDGGNKLITTEVLSISISTLYKDVLFDYKIISKQSDVEIIKKDPTSDGWISEAEFKEYGWKCDWTTDFEDSNFTIFWIKEPYPSDTQYHLKNAPQSLVNGDTGTVTYNGSTIRYYISSDTFDKIHLNYDDLISAGIPFDPNN